MAEWEFSQEGWGKAQVAAVLTKTLYERENLVVTTEKMYLTKKERVNLKKIIIKDFVDFCSLLDEVD